MSPERAGSPLAMEPRELALALQSAVPPFQLVRLQLSQAAAPPAPTQPLTTQNVQQDDDLTSLTWLQDNNLLRGMNLTCVKTENEDTAVNTQQAQQKTYTSAALADRSPTSDYMDDSSVSEPTDSSSSSLNSPVPSSPLKSNVKHPRNVKYDPMVHTFSKPPYSFSCLIFMAIEDSPAKALPVKDIYAWILDHFPYFKNAPTGWKNSVRHNLSLNKCFQKVEKSPNLGKGSLWMVDPQYRPNLMQALNRSPCHPCSTLDPAMLRSNATRNSSSFVQHIMDSSNKQTTTRLPNPELFPYLARRLAASEGKHDVIKTEPASQSDDESSLDDVDAAAAILALKHGPINTIHRKVRSNYVDPSELVQVITTSPSEDHRYSVTDNRASSPDEAFESDDSRSRSNYSTVDLEEQRRIEEGADALLNLAGISTLRRKQTNSSIYIKRKRPQQSQAALDLSDSDDDEASYRRHMKRKYAVNNNNVGDRKIRVGRKTDWEPRVKYHDGKINQR